MRGIPPVLIETTVAEVNFQTEHLGWETDDFLIVCERAEGTDRKLAGQVKRRFTVSAADDDCKRAIQDFWRDFRSPERFSPADDRLILVTQRGTNTVLEHFVGLLDCARTARDGREFENRLGTTGFISDTARRYCDELCKIIADLDGGAVAPADIWPFLCVLHVLSLDLNTSTRQTEALIRSLLAYTIDEGHASDVAGASWNALLALASTAMPEARSLRRADLPSDLQERHGSLGTKEQRILRALQDHTTPVLDRIRSTIGQDFHLPRAALVQQVLGELETAQVVLVTGPAGSGKSAIGKDAILYLSQEHFAIGFRVEEFAKPHIDETLRDGQIPANGKTLAAILATQGRKVVLVESVERLLEKTTRDAFSDLMELAAADRSMCIVLTCRDYSTEQVRASFLRPAAIEHTVVNVPPLNDEELAEVEGGLPKLAYPLANSALRSILRNPYFLDQALEISWSPERPVPESEREFRRLFWNQIVRTDQGAAAGMAQRREEVFQEIAVRRARALSAYVSGKDLNPEVVARLKRDSLIISSDEHPSLVATTHDVLEDWAILQWLEDQHLTGEGSFRDLSAAIGAHPAIRRSYRKWVAELLDRDPDAADGLFSAATSEADVSPQFRDDTLVSLLKAPGSPDFLIRHEAELLGNDKTILKRAIHLLRVACVTTPDWLPRTAAHGSILNVPDGPAWATVLELVYENMDSITPQEHSLILGLIEDAVRNVSWWAPELDGAEFVAGIGYWLLACFDDYSSEEPRKRVLKVIAKIPMADAACFEAVLSGPVTEGQHRDRTSDDFRELLLAGMEGMPAARDLPGLVVSVATDYLLATEDDLDRDIYSQSSIDLETDFGFKDGLHHEFYPPSAYRGPWIPLLRHHPRIALEFLHSVFNHSIDWYVNPRVDDRLEAAWEIELTFADGSTHMHWGNPRLWQLYRGTSVGPDVLKSMLIALEAWLLEIASQHPGQLDGILVGMLRRTESATVASVVASVATAHPRKCGEALLVLLSARHYIEFDRRRMALESEASLLSGMFPQLRAEDEIYEAERKNANSLPHRKKDLEVAIANLQLGPLAPRVHAILDQHLSALPATSEQGEADLVWRLAIHRMDMRRYTVADESGPETLDDDTSTGEPAEHVIRLELEPLDPEVQAMVDEHALELTEMNARLSVLLWGLQVFRRENGNHDPSEWREKLAEAQPMDREADRDDGGRHGPGIIAAVCVRDHWDEMSVEERDWCVDVVCSEILHRADEWNPHERMQRYSMGADRPCSAVVSLLLGKPLGETQMQLVRRAFVAALTHPTDEVRQYACSGINGQFWDGNRDLALRCVNAIATEAALIDQARKAEEGRPYDQRRTLVDIGPEAAAAVRDHFWHEGAITENAHSTLDISEGFGSRSIGSMLAILGQVPGDAVAVDAFARTSQTLADWWDAEDSRRRRRDRDFHLEAALSQLLQEFVMRTSRKSAVQVLRPVLEAIDRHPREIYSIVQGLTVIEDGRQNTEHYWYLWDLFADRVKGASWVARLDRRHPTGSEMLSAIFLTSWWKENVRHWRSLEGHADHVHDLFEALPPAPIVFGDYVRFLYHIGEQSLPAAFVRVANALEQGNAQTMLAQSNTIFMLEVLLQRHVYGRPLELKRNDAIRDAALSILDNLVEGGSSAAFRMRDDLVTPAA